MIAHDRRPLGAWHHVGLSSDPGHATDAHLVPGTTWVRTFSRSCTTSGRVAQWLG